VLLDPLESIRINNMGLLDAFIGAVPVAEFLSGSNLYIDSFGNAVPDNKPDNVRYIPYNSSKRGIPVCGNQYLFFKYHQFPYRQGYDVAVSWNQSLDKNRLFDVVIEVVSEKKTLIFHPFTFCRITAGVHGPTKALDALKMVMNDHIKRLANKHFRPIERKIDAARNRNM
jgi:hypothetical protein